MQYTQKSARPSFSQEVWNLFVSVKLTVIVMLLLAISSIVGTLIPQNQSLHEYHDAYGEFWFRVFHHLDFYDMYHAVWFQMLLLLLILNIIACSIDRLSAVWKIIFPKKINFNPARYKKSSIQASCELNQTPDALKNKIKHIISKRFGHTSLEDTPDGFRIFAERGRRTRLGVYFVHLSVVLLALGAIIGNISGFDGFVTIGEGEKVDSIQLRNSNNRLPLDFEIQCNKFMISFYKESNMPKEYRSDLTLLKNGKPIYEKEIIVNDPIRYQGINIYQSSYGEMPPQEVNLSITGKSSGLSYAFKLKRGESIDIPENLGRFTFQNVMDNINFRGQTIRGMALIGTISRETKPPVEVIVPFHFPMFDRMRKGDVFISVTNFTPRYYTGLQVTHDPGVPFVYTGFIIMILGCYVTFFMSHHSVCIEALRADGKTEIKISGVTNRNKLSMQTKIKQLAKKLTTA